MMEEFLELSRRISVQTIRDFVQAVHKRIPPLFLERPSCNRIGLRAPYLHTSYLLHPIRKEFLDLAECTVTDANVQRNFRNWLRRQNWMKALPPPTTNLVPI